MIGTAKERGAEEWCLRMKPFGLEWTRNRDSAPHGESDGQNESLEMEEWNPSELSQGSWMAEGKTEMAPQGMGRKEGNRRAPIDDKP